MEVKQVVENPDGSAEYTFDMTDVEVDITFEQGLKAIHEPPKEHTLAQWEAARDSLIRLGIITAIVNGIENAEKDSKATPT